MNRIFPAFFVVSLLSGSLALADEPAKPAKDAYRNTVAVAATSAAGAPRAKAGQAASQPGGRTRAEVRAEAVDAVKHHRTPFEESFDLLKN